MVAYNNIRQYIIKKMKTKRLFGCLSFIPRLGFCAYYPYPDLMKEFIIETNTGKSGIYM